MSRKYESSGKSSTIARTPGDPGGASYGLYQLTENSGSAQEFVNYLKDVDRMAYTSLYDKKPGSDAFDKAWGTVAASNNNFAQYQHDFIQNKYYVPAVNGVAKNNGIDVSKRSQALQNAIWSTAVQHGSGSVSKIMKNAGITSSMADAEIIRRLYTERGANNGKKYFKSSSEKVQSSVANRFKNEMKEALRMLS